MSINIKLIVTSPSFSKNNFLQNEVSKFFPDARLNLDGLKFNQDELIEFIKDAEALIVGLDVINSEVLNQCKKLKMISKIKRCSNLFFPYIFFTFYQVNRKTVSTNSSF